jgi:hypothetical protein
VWPLKGLLHSNENLNNSGALSRLSFTVSLEAKRKGVFALETHRHVNRIDVRQTVQWASCLQSCMEAGATAFRQCI